tara:strand:+ start:2531 stop:2689 length:159 start_codon:yes stop_codon:yes gene_type:complete
MIANKSDMCVASAKLTVSLLGVANSLARHVSQNDFNRNCNVNLSEWQENCAA